MAFADTNILLRLLLRDDRKLFIKAKNIVETAAENELKVTSITFAEIIYILRIKGYDRAQIIKAIYILMQIPEFSYDSSIAEKSLKYFDETKLDFADCYLLVRALAGSEELKTLDVGLQKIYKLEKKKITSISI